MFKALLCIPPCYCYTYDFPPLGTPLLSGYLREKGIEALQADYNMGYLNYWKKKVLKEKILQNVSTLEASETIRGLLNRIFQEKSKRNYYYSAHLAPDFISCYDDNTNTSFHFTERLLSSEHLFRYIEDIKENTFLQFFTEEDILSEIDRQGIDLVGISIIAPSQVIASFTLGRLIKKNLPGIHVTIGGQWVSLYRERIKNNPEWARFFDSIIFFEGETPLYNLINSLCDRRDLSSVPNLIYKSDSKWIQSHKNSKEDLNKLACPDFDGLPLKDYAAVGRTGKISLTYQTARECYWNNCIYCVDLPLPKQRYRERDVDLVIDDLKKLIKRYKMGFLEISNATISSRQVKRLSEKIIDEGLDFSWWCFARLDEAFNKDIFNLAKKAGCETIVFGLESGNQRVLDFIKKGINIDKTKAIITDCHNAGIKVNLQMMMGLPSETVQEALDTVKFLIEYRNYIQTVTFNTYYLTPACQVYLDPLEYGIDYKRHPRIPFKFFHEFSHISGEVSKTKANGLINLYHQLLFKKNEKDIQNPPSPDFNFDPHLSEHSLSLTIGEDTVSMVYRFNKEKNEGVIADNIEVAENV